MQPPQSPRVYRFALVAGLLLGFVVAIAACSGSGGASSEEYQKQVLETLRGDPLADTGLGQILSETLGDLRCEGEICTSVLRFQYLRAEANERQFTIADFQGQLCSHSSKLKPPASLTEDHNALCTELGTLFKSLDAIKTNSSTALRLSGPSGQKDPETNSLLEEFSRRLERERENLLQLQQRLQEIDWLRPIL
jgi:hypothetical protein